MTRAYLGFSFRWRPDRPEEGVTFDHEGRAHSAIFVTNHGGTPAYQVRFRGCLVVAPVEEATLDEALAACAWSHPNIANPNGHPLYFRMATARGPTKVPSLEHLFAVGEVEYHDVTFRTLTAGVTPGEPALQRTRFCAIYRGDEGWDAAPFLNDGT